MFLELLFKFFFFKFLRTLPVRNVQTPFTWSPPIGDVLERREDEKKKERDQQRKQEQLRWSVNRSLSLL